MAKLGSFLKPLAPPDRVSPARYRLGLFMFCIPLIFGIVQPYAAHFYEPLKEVPLWANISSDLLFIASFFVLGGDFWDKLRGLFQHGVIAMPREK